MGCKPSRQQSLLDAASLDDSIHVLLRRSSFGNSGYMPPKPHPLLVIGKEETLVDMDKSMGSSCLSKRRAQKSESDDAESTYSSNTSLSITDPDQA